MTSGSTLGNDRLNSRAAKAVRSARHDSNCTFDSHAGPVECTFEIMAEASKTFSVDTVALATLQKAEE